MKRTNHLSIFVMLVLILATILSACAFSPVVDQATFAGTQTARAVTVEPTATATLAPPAATATEMVVEATLEATPEPQCLVKGNINSRKERIYYLPSSSHWKSVIIDPEHGEMWFCSAADAETAGWRAAKN